MTPRWVGRAPAALAWAAWAVLSLAYLAGVVVGSVALDLWTAARFWVGYLAPGGPERWRQQVAEFEERFSRRAA